jgi:transcriptional regulator with XRE-family HTH domain
MEAIKDRGKRIQQRRLGCSLSQAKLAELCDTSQRQISDLENGKTKRPDVLLLEKIEDVLSMRRGLLLGTN